MNLSELNWQPDTWMHLIETIGLVVIGFVTTWQIMLLRRQLKDEHRKDRIAMSLDLDKRLIELRPEREILDKHFDPQYYKDTPVPQDKLLEAFGLDANLEPCLESFLNEFETIALMTYAQSVDEDTTYELVGGIIIRYGTRFSEYIRYSREAEARPNIYIYLEHLVNRWKSRKEEGGFLIQLYRK